MRKNHVKVKNWYERSIFRVFCASWNRPVYRKLNVWLEEDSILLDVGCGSGEFLMESAAKLKRGIGLELSDRLLKQANRKLNLNRAENISFQRKDFLSWKEPDAIDTISLIFTLHEIEPVKRDALLNKALDLAEHVFIADYKAPQPLNFAGLLNYWAEALTSQEHFTNFKHYNSTHWLTNFISKNNINVLESSLLYSGSYQLLKLSR